MLKVPSELDTSMICVVRPSKYKEILLEFLDTNESIMEYIRENNETSLKNIRYSLSRTIRIYDFPVKVHLRNGRLFLLRTDM